MSLKNFVSYGDAETVLTSYANEIANKVDKVSGKGLSTKDYTLAEKTKLAGIEAEANKTVVDDYLSKISNRPVRNSAITNALCGSEFPISNRIAAFNYDNHSLYLRYLGFIMIDITLTVIDNNGFEVTKFGDNIGYINTNGVTIQKDFWTYIEVPYSTPGDYNTHYLTFGLSNTGHMYLLAKESSFNLPVGSKLNISLNVLGRVNS